MSFEKLYYAFKPFMPRWLQIYIRRRRVEYLWEIHKERWPIDHGAGAVPASWQSWPDGKRFALVLTHDVEKEKGQDKCCRLSALEEKYGFRSSYNLVPERYTVSPALREHLTKRGFEVGVHDLRHDGKLFSSRGNFQIGAVRINHYLREWNALGFRAGAMHHNLEWIGELNVKYDLSTFDTDPFEPQSDGVRTIFPFWVNSGGEGGGYVELPYTLVQDFTLFILMREQNTDIWKSKLDWISKRGGMALLNVHPDYINFDGQWKLEEYPVQLYTDFLKYVQSHYGGQFWNALPCEVASFIKSGRSKQEESIEEKMR